MLRFGWILLGITLTCPAVAAAPSRGDDPRLTAILRKLSPANAERIPGSPETVYGSLSPDGRYFAHLHEYVRENVEGTQGKGIQLFSRTGKLVVELTYPQFYRVEGFVWSTSGRAIYFWVNGALDSNPGTGGIWKTDLQGRRFDRLRLPWMPVSDMPHLPLFSPTGESYLVTVPNPSGPHASSSQVYRIWMRSGRIKLLADGDDPVWSPDGAWIAFRRERPPRARVQDEVWLMRADGGSMHPIPYPTRRQMEEQLHHSKAKKVVASGTAWLRGRGRMLVGGGLWDGAESLLDQGLWVVDGSRSRAEWFPGVSVSMASADGRTVYLSASPCGLPMSTYVVTLGALRLPVRGTDRKGVASRRNQ